MCIVGVRWQHRSGKKKNGGHDRCDEKNVDVVFRNFIALIPSLMDVSSRILWTSIGKIKDFLVKNPSSGNWSTITQWFTIPFKSSLCLFRKEKNAWKENDGKSVQHQTAYAIGCDTRGAPGASRIYCAFNERVKSFRRDRYTRIRKS